MSGALTFVNRSGILILMFQSPKITYLLTYETGSNIEHLEVEQSKVEETIKELEKQGFNLIKTVVYRIEKESK